MAIRGSKKYLCVTFCLISFLISSRPSSSASNSDNQLQSRLKAFHLDKYIGIKYTSHKPNPNYPDFEIYSYDTANCKCVEGAEYFVAACPDESSNNVLFYLAGGGVCWPGYDFCARAVSYEEASEPTRIIPLSGWNYIFVPYCDGSVHMGDNEVDIDGDGVPDRWYWGLRGTSAAVAVMKELHPSPDKILIAGNSAGGYGTIFATMLMRLQYPRTKLYVFSKAGPGIFNPEDSDTWELIKESWNIKQFFPADCEKCNDQITYLFDWMLERDNNLKVGLASAYHDLIIGGMTLKTTPQKYKEMLMSTTDAIHKKHPDTFKRFFIKGTEHNISNSYEVYGVTLREWLGHLVNDSPKWKDILE